MGTRLVMGASGFLGSQVVRQLVEQGDDVRVWLRPTSSARAFAGLEVEVVRAELTDAAALRAAMIDVDAVHYCIVDTRAWLRDPAPLFETNVELLRQVLDVAVEAQVPRFVFCSTVGTIGIVPTGVADESVPHEWAHLGGPYIRSRMAAEELVLSYCRDHDLPAVVLCVSTTYGPGDYGPTPHGQMIGLAARGKMPAYVRGAAMEVVPVRDAARAFVLAEQRGRPGERYIISERMMPIRETLAIAAEAGGVSPPRFGVPIAVLRVVAAIGGLVARVRRVDSTISLTTVRLMHVMSALDHGKATRELGWEPGSTPDAIRGAVAFFAAERRAAQASASIAVT